MAPNPIISNLLSDLLSDSTPQNPNLPLGVPNTAASRTSMFGNQLRNIIGGAQKPATLTGGGDALGKGGLVDRIAAAIRQHESGGNYNAHNPHGANGAYQFIPSTWASVNKMFGGDYSWTPANQDKVAKAYIQSILNQYHTTDPGVVAATWYVGGYDPNRNYNYVPAPGAGNTQTVESYMDQMRRWVNGG